MPTDGTVQTPQPLKRRVTLRVFTDVIGKPWVEIEETGGWRHPDLTALRMVLHADEIVVEDNRA